jgi:hypothetical protein
LIPTKSPGSPTPVPVMPRSIGRENPSSDGVVAVRSLQSQNEKCGRLCFEREVDILGHHIRTCCGCLAAQR